MDRKTAFERVKTYSDVVRQNFSVRKVILYGSYAKGRPRKHSDIDVAVVLSETDKDFLIRNETLPVAKSRRPEDRTSAFSGRRGR